MTPRAFENRTVLLTGVGREGQVGEMLARRFAEAGASLLLVDVDVAETQRRVDGLQSTGARAVALGCDLTDPAQVDALAEHVTKQHGGVVDALVHLAGGFAMSGRVDSSDVKVWHRQFAINLTTAYLTTRAFLPMLRRSAGGGAMVYFASAATLPGVAAAEMSAYVAAKSGVLALMRAVAQEEKDTGVRANAVAPTSIRTSANLASMGATARYVEREEVADAVLFLCSDAARRITGQVLQLA